jgi:succinyl-CoA synthetase beta subunit
MKLYEYQARTLFEKYGIASVQGFVAETPDEAEGAAKKLGGTCVVKAQVLVGGRGKAGGVKIAASPDEARHLAEQILEMSIRSLAVERVLVTKGVDIEQEFYIGLTIDRAEKAITLLTSAAGGIDIEELAEREPAKIRRLTINTLQGLDGTAADDLLGHIFENPEHRAQALDTVQKLYRLFTEMDCSLVEINPYALTRQGGLLALDAKIVIDDSGVFKHEELENFRNRQEYGPDELEAREWGLSFINMDGTIGCIVNGAGLAMATMDIIKLFGGSPANFLDVGGSSSPEKVLKAFEIISHNDRVKAILINIFGGITRCDDIAKGILQARERMNLAIPLVIRLIGTNEKEGRSLLEEAGIEAYENLTEAVRKVVEFS